ncbi:hypothetical protein [Abyssibacter sp.]|jgi:hypothetical protein|uniref:hypothetical protein n=1 Tax=Abyssibacter sp. TaxID=2320200 RepID=UPI0025C423C8|nr:hypothetical protein [Abyssibacter sp.]MCK5857763.1 hypothetical protein [Abyssibacter sp.]
MNETTRNALMAASVSEPDLDRLAGLGADAQQTLASLLQAAQAQQARQLQQAMEGMLDAMPRLLRGPVKKLFER